MLAVTGASTAADQAASPVILSDEELTNVVIPDQKPNERRIWWMDFANGLYGRSFLFNADTGDLLGIVDTGWEGIKLDIPKQGEVFFNHGMFMARGFRGPRTDVIEIFNRKTLAKEGEIELPAKMIRGWPNLNHSSLSDDDRFLFVQFFTPGSSIGVVDLKARKYVGEVETAGCAHIMAAGPKRFFTLCGDGSLLSVNLDDSGKEVSRDRVEKAFNPDTDALQGTGVRAGNLWYFVTQKGVVKPIDVSGPKLRLQRGWNGGEIAGDKGWVPGDILQNLAYHGATGNLYVLMHDASLAPKGGGPDYHRHPGTEVWVWDTKTRKRLRRIPLSQPSSAIAVSHDASPLLYASSLFSNKLLVIDAVGGRELRKIEGGAMPTLIVPVAP